MGLKEEAEQWMKERYMSNITATEYQRRAAETAIFPSDKALEYLTLGLTGEAGEIANKVKKLIRDGADREEHHAKLNAVGHELGDVMWYVMQACIGLGVDLNDVIEMNIDKLKSRYPGGEFDAHYSENRKQGDL